MVDSKENYKFDLAVKGLTSDLHVFFVRQSKEGE